MKFKTILISIIILLIIVILIFGYKTYNKTNNFINETKPVVDKMSILFGVK